TGFSLLPGAKSGPLGFSFSQPAAAPSISAHNNPLSTGNTSGPSNTLQFTFSQPAAPSSSSIQASTSQPTTPSSFSFSVQPTEPQATHLFGPFGDTKAKADINSDDKVTNLEETNKFARLSKGTKRKEDPAVSSTGSEKPIIAEDFPAEADLPRQPSKRSLMRTHGPLGGLFGRALSDLRRDGTNPVRRRENSESLSGMSPTDCTTIQCRNVPAALNKKEIIEKHFGRFGKVRKVFCRPAKNLAIVHFDDHVSAAKAKKKGKVLQRHELLLLWQRKKQSPVKRSSLAKSLQFDTEPQKESYTETQSSECLIPSSLLHLIGRVAETAEDKYRLLEQRDKILRQRAKRTDLDMSRVFVGTCPDMCPEKERFMRETRKQLSIYEVLPDTEMVDHSAAIKEYSRSSADQEEPLPHDLRPLPVLSMTMDYLVTQIMDQGHDNYRDWYDFVWNRTRGIRKDITQQRLCCPHTVSLIEKCTRFHVHCAHHLCEEHMSSFDAKINNENMTKCLQSLKEMYQDLATRQIYCSRESEFRQYSVLLKLNDGDILEVQQFREEVRNSPEVKFAVQAFAAVNSNNFVRFFKLVKGASYLASCLLHRYFNQVRAKALKAFNLAHTVGPRSTAFPLDDLVRMLMFHNIGEAADFIQQYGLNVNDSVVELSRTYQEPDLPLSQKKSDVILAKKTVLIGEVVNGGPLPNHPQHSLVCSFDSQNKYRGEGPMAEATPQPVNAPSPPPKPQPVYSNESEVLGQMLEEMLSAEIELERQRVAEEKRKLVEIWRNVVAVRRQLKRQMRGFPAAPCCVDPRFKLKALAPSAPAQPSIADLTRGLVSLGNAGMLALSSTLLKMRQGVIHQMRVHYFYQQLLEAVWAPLNLPALVTENFSSPPDRIFWKAILLLPSDHDSVSNMEDILSDWLQSKFSGDRELKLSDEQLDGTLKTLCVTDTLQEKEECIHRVYISIKQASRGPLTEESLSKIEEYHELHGTGALITLLPAMSIVQPEQDVPLLSALLQLKQLQKASTWHCPLPLVILVPGQNDRDTQIIEKALMLNTLVEEGLISEYMFLFIPETTSDLQGSKQMNWLLARAPPPIPLSCQTLVQLVETSLSREFSPRVYAQRQERAAAFLPPLDPAPVIQLYNAVLAHVADKVSSKELSRLSWPPCEFCQAETRDFVPPLGWNSVKHLDWLHKAVLSLQLPQWKQLSAASWSELCSSICRYAAQIPVSRRSQPLLMSRLENLLERVRLNCHCTQIPGSNLIASNWVDVDEDVCPAFSQIPWVDVLVICIDHKLKDWEVRGQPVCETITENGEILVYFVTESLNGFKPPDEWTHAVRETHREKKTPPVSLTWRLRELERQVLSSQEEELACRLKLHGMLNIVDD
uniref:Germinal-center associated nuclear protein n=1 Tax=Mola mola TaxID=94237 RepID=A0A3Q3WCP2_MOLML